jgi:hypothetical protein
MQGIASTLGLVIVVLTGASLVLGLVILVLHELRYVVRLASRIGRRENTDPTAAVYAAGKPADLSGRQRL